MNTLVIEKSALKNNISLVKEQAGASYIYANLSGDGYGAGAVPLAKLLRDEGIRRFCVDSADTAAALRKAGLVDEEILMLHSTSDREVLEKLSDLNVVCSVGTLEAGMALNALAEKYEEAIKIYEDVAQSCLEKNVLKFNAKGHLFNAGILHLCEGVFHDCKVNGVGCRGDETGAGAL